VFTTVISNPVLVYASNNQTKKELEKEFSNEIQGGFLNILVEKMSGMKKLHHILSIGKSTGTVGAIIKADDETWYGISCAHCFVDYEVGKTDNDTNNAIKTAVNMPIFKREKFVVYIQEIAINIDPKDVQLFYNEL
jgi:hypothetical protein